MEQGAATECCNGAAPSGTGCTSAKSNGPTLLAANGHVAARRQLRFGLSGLDQPPGCKAFTTTGSAGTVGDGGGAAARGEPDSGVRLVGQPEARPHGRMGVARAQGATEEEARRKADAAAAQIQVKAQP